MANFTQEEIAAAIKVLSHSKIVENWAQNMLKSYGLQPDTPEGKQFLRRERIAAAQRLIK